MTSEGTVSRLPHTNTQLARGTIGLFVGGLVALLIGTVVTLLDAPLWVTAALGALVLVGLVVAVVSPVWYWVIEPAVRRGREQ